MLLIEPVYTQHKCTKKNNKKTKIIRSGKEKERHSKIFLVLKTQNYTIEKYRHTCNYTLGLGL